MNYELRQALFLIGFFLVTSFLCAFVFIPIWTRIERFMARWNRYKKWEQYYYGKRKDDEIKN